MVESQLYIYHLHLKVVKLYWDKRCSLVNYMKEYTKSLAPQVKLLPLDLDLFYM